MYVDIPVAMRGLSQHTQRAYQRWMREFLGSVDLSALLVDDLKARMTVSLLKTWLGQLKVRDLGMMSIGQAKSAIVWLSQYLADLEIISYEIPWMLTRIKTPRAERGQRAGVWLSLSEMQRLVEAARNRPLHNPARKARNVAILVLLTTLGLRREEVTTMHWGDITRQGAYTMLRVHGKGEKIRSVKLPAMTQRALDAWRIHHPDPRDSQMVFVGLHNGVYAQLSTKMIYCIVREAAQLANLPQISTHDLRRSFARGAYDAGVSLELIRQTLGHSSVVMTEHYVNCRQELDRTATDIWAELMDGSAAK